MKKQNCLSVNEQIFKCTRNIDILTYLNTTQIKTSILYSSIHNNMLIISKIVIQVCTYSTSTQFYRMFREYIMVIAYNSQLQYS